MMMMKRSINFKDFRQKANPILVVVVDEDRFSFPSTKISIHRTISKRKSSISLQSKGKCEFSIYTQNDNTTPKPFGKPMWHDICLFDLFTSHKLLKYAKQTTYNWLFDVYVLYKFTCVFRDGPTHTKKKYRHNIIFLLCCAYLGFDCFATKMFRINVTWMHRRTTMIINNFMNCNTFIAFFSFVSQPISNRWKWHTSWIVFLCSYLFTFYALFRLIIP